MLTASDPAQLAYARSRSEQLGDLFKTAMGKVTRITLAEPAGEDDAGEAAPAARGPIDREALEHPLVKRTMELFSARVVTVQPDDEK